METPHLSANANAALSIKNLSCIRNDRLLFEQIDFCLHPHQLLQINGHNGSGKTSLLRILCGLSLAETGTIYWQGQDIDDQLTEYNSQLNYIGHYAGIKDDLTALENLRISQALRVHRTEVDLDDALDRIGLFGFEEVPTRQLSAGQKRRVALARLLVCPAQLWVLDEPFTALDKIGIKMVEELLMTHVEAGGIVVLTSHHPPRCDGLLHLHLSD